MKTLLTRRHFVLGTASLASLALAGCSTTAQLTPAIIVPTAPIVPIHVLNMYAAMPFERFPVPAADIALVDPVYWRQEVENITGEREGCVVVDTPNRLLYWTLPGGRAMRYGVGIGRDGFAWGGRARIAYKREWPRWTPPAAMIERQPELEIYRNGMEPRLDNPLGARALYIHNQEGDTLYRIHGSMDARSIGQSVSSGCVRLLYQDVIDLYGRVPDGSPIVVIQ